jgi:CO/xanthine dehydrogenase Mo-binding subunit/aerobic-type carbon monoxide dehydrogenase small subunit (CoxS/CutS family)
MELTFSLNAESITLNVDPARPLLDVLREELGLTGTKRGCDYEGECGACTVLLDGQPVRSCLTPAGKAAGCEVTTVEGLGSREDPHPLQKAFLHTGAVQCGYCTPGMLLSAKALLDREPDPSRGQILEALAGNLCRCTGYHAIVQAVQRAAAQMRGEESSLQPETGPVIGGNPFRTDALEKVTGQAKYVEDMTRSGLLTAKILRSPHHHARLLSLDTSPAEDQEGVVRVITAADIPGENGLGDYSRNEPVLTPIGETLRMKGAPIAIVVARSPTQAEEALRAIDAVCQPLPHTFALEETLAEDALPIYPAGNILTEEAEQRGDIQQILGTSDFLLETEYRTAWQEHAALEREALLGYYDHQGRLTVVGGTHQPHWQQGYIAAALNLDPEQVRVIMPPTGGSFGGKQDPWPFIATALAVYSTQKAVRLAYSRSESFLASPKRHPYRVRYRIGATRDGELTGIQARVSANTGGYDAHGQYIANYALTASGGPYRYQAVDAQAQSVYTNGPKAGQFRGFGAPQSIFALECTLDEMAQKLDMDPLVFRRKNALKQNTISFLGYPVAESLGYQEVMDAIQPHYQAYQEEARTFDPGPNPLRMGAGLAGMWYRFGKSGSLKTRARAELTRAGTFRISCSAPDYGQGTNTAMAQMAAESLGVSRDQIQIINADTAHTPDSGIQGASRATYFVGGAVCQAAYNLKRSIFATAAELLDCHPDDLELRGTSIRCASGRPGDLSLQDAARDMDRVGKAREVLGVFDLSPHFPEENRPEYIPLFVTGMQAAQVVVDLETGETRVTRLAAAHDVGRAVNPIDARGQIEGAMMMGLGTALMEEYLPGESTGFSDYYLPTSMSLPEFSVELVEVPSYQGPFGAKGLGEAAILPSAPAIINGISRATGTRIRQLPATPERVLKALQRRGS